MAHLLDLQRDTSNKKFEDFDFMEKFVKNNYLLLQKGMEKVSILQATPNEAFSSLSNFSDVLKNLDLNKLLGIDQLGKYLKDEDQKTQLLSLLESKINLGLEKKSDTYTDETVEILKFFYDSIKDKYSLNELINSTSTLYQKLFEDPKVYKKIRKFSIDNLQLKNKFDINIDDINFNEDMKNSPLKKSFFEFVTTTLSYRPNLTQYNFNFFITAYTSMNLLGIDKESNGKLKFSSMSNDSQHSFYGSHCDYVISDDKGFLHKSKILYKLLGIKTKVMHIEEFSKKVDKIAEEIHLKIDDYLLFLFKDFDESLFIEDKIFIENGFKRKTYKAVNSHFSYFNYFYLIEQIKEKPYYLYFKQLENLSSFIIYEEIKAITNKMSNIFGIDIHEKKSFISSEIKEINNKTWEGRTWIFQEITFILQYDYEINKLLYYVYIK